MSQGMHLSNTETVPGKLITASFGLVQGSTVRAKNVFKDIGAGLKNMVGGELKAYTELLQEARNEALQRMMMDAQGRGANAIVNVRFATSAVAGGAAELFAYGTAVTVELGDQHGWNKLSVLPTSFCFIACVYLSRFMAVW